MSPVTVECHILDDRYIAMGTTLMAVCRFTGTRTRVWRFSLGHCFLAPCVVCRVVPHQSLSVKNETGGHVPRRFLVPRYAGTLDLQSHQHKSPWFLGPSRSRLTQKHLLHNPQSVQRTLTQCLIDECFVYLVGCCVSATVPNFGVRSVPPPLSTTGPLPSANR